jgi:hypothetical protein
MRVMTIRRYAVVVAVALGSFAACTENPDARAPTTLATSERIPGAHGTFEVSSGPSGNTVVRVAVKHMAPPQKVTSGATTYVVWVKPLTADGEPQNMGAMKLDGEQHGVFESMTPFRSFELFLTAEPSPSTQEPRGEKMLWGRVED